MNNRILYAAAAVLLIAGIGAGTWYVLNQNDVQPESTPQQNQTSTIPTSTPGSESTTETLVAAEGVSYQGEEGQTALALLQKHAEVELDGEGEMAFVTTINGYKAKENEFWAFYINGD